MNRILRMHSAKRRIKISGQAKWNGIEGSGIEGNGRGKSETRRMKTNNRMTRTNIFSFLNVEIIHIFRVLVFT